MISNNYVKVPLNDVVMEIVEGIWRLKDATFSKGDEVYSSITRNNSVVRCKRDHASSSYPQSCVRGSMIQTLIYLLSQYKHTSNKNIVFKASEVSRLRNMAPRSENRKTLIQDLQFLSEVEMKIQHKVKNKHHETFSSLLKFRIIDHSVQVIFDSWIEAVSPNKYVEVPTEFFHFKGKRYSNTILAILKITQLKHMAKRKLRVDSLLGYLGYDQFELHHKRLSAVKLLVTNIVNDINKVDRDVVKLAQVEFTSLLELQNTLIHITAIKKVDTS